MDKVNTLYLPVELIDYIFLLTDFNTCVINKKEYCLEKYCKMYDNVWGWVIGNGYLESVKWLHINKKEKYNTWCMDIAVENSDIEMVKFLFKIVFLEKDSKYFDITYTKDYVINI